MRTSKHKVGVCTAALLMVFSISSPARAESVSVGMVRLPTAVFVGIARGYFAAESLQIQMVFSQSGGELVPALSTGRIDVAIASPGAALFNAMALGVDVKMVADCWVAASEPVAHDYAYIVARKDLGYGAAWTSRAIKGRTIAITARGQMTELLAEAFLHRHGLRLSDVRLVQMPFASMEIALRNHAVDFAAAIEPYAELGTRDGISVKLDGISALMPGFVQAVVLYGPRLSMRQRSVGLRFMHAFIRANRFLNSSLNTAEGRRTIAGIYQRAIPMDDPTIYRTVGLPQSPSDLAVRLPGAYGLNWQLQTYAERGLVASRPDLASFVDPTLVPPRSGKRP